MGRNFPQLYIVDQTRIWQYWLICTYIRLKFIPTFTSATIRYIWIVTYSCRPQMTFDLKENHRDHASTYQGLPTYHVQATFTWDIVFSSFRLWPLMTSIDLWPLWKTIDFIYSSSATYIPSLKFKQLEHQWCSGSYIVECYIMEVTMFCRSEY